MTTRIYKATMTSSDRPGWSVTFSHPLRSDARGKLGLKMRRGLGTTDKEVSFAFRCRHLGAFLRRPRTSLFFSHAGFLGGC